VMAGAGLGYILARVASSGFLDVKMPGPAPVAAAALVLMLSAVVASTLPAVRAARVDVIEALRSE